MVQATVNANRYEITADTDAITVNSQAFTGDMIEVRNGVFHFLYNNRSFNATVLEADYQTKSFLIKVNKNVYTVNVKDRFDILLDQLGMSNANSAKVNDLKAPMPGLIVELKVAVGDTIKKGDTLLILEAMKMENVLKAVGDATVKAIKIAAKQNVEKNQILIEFE
jgi:biotin carboxyl carrier protein